MADEVVVLDPSEVATARTELDINSGAIKVLAAGIDWGDSEITTYMAEQQRGEAPVDYRIPNRHISIPLKLSTSGTVSFDQARQKLQSKVARLQQEGGWIKRVTNTAGTVFADVVNASLHLPHSWLAEHKSIEIETTLALEAIPDFYGAEIQQADHTETSASELVFTETSLKGNYPARVRVVVDEDQGVNQLGLIWSFRSRHYSSASTAAVKYEAEALQALDTARILALSGASGGTAVTHGTISTNWTPIVGTNVGGTSYLTHTGTNRIYARVYSTSGTTVQTRFVWDVGDLVAPAENNAWRLPGASNFYIADLGEVHLDQIPIGTHRWQGQIQAKGDVGTENVSIDKVWIVNADEGMGVLRAPLASPQEGLSTYSARSEFNTESGAITGDTLATGGTWQGAGDADDVTVAGGIASRAAVSDTGGNVHGGRLLGPSGATSLTNVVTTIDFRFSAFSATQPIAFLIPRYVALTDFFSVYAAMNLSGVMTITPQTRVASSYANLGEVYVFGMDINTWMTLMVQVDAAGNYSVWFGSQGTQTLPLVKQGSSATLATGGALASGQPRWGDYYSAASPAVTRDYDNFAAWVPTSDAVLYASRSAQLCWNGHFRQDVGGTAYGPVSQVTGDLPRIPPAGLEGRPVEVFLKATRSDLQSLPDTGIDDISARISYRASWLFIPE